MRNDTSREDADRCFLAHPEEDREAVGVQDLAAYGCQPVSFDFPVLPFSPGLMLRLWSHTARPATQGTRVMFSP
jgi:hypothetical protein